jgi:hypothetical protein
MELTMERVDLVTEAERLVAAAQEHGVVARMLGGVAVAMRCPTARTEPFARDYSDLDVVIRQRDRAQIDAVLGELGFTGDRAFNARFGNERRCYHREDGLKLDVFVECFSMCHDVPLDADRIEIDSRTVPLAELLLTKAQIVELNHKDAQDLFVLFHDHEPAGDDGGINTERAGEVCARDWGLWRTVTGTLLALREALPSIEAAPHAREQVAKRAQNMIEALEATPKSRKWKLRSRVGERKQWYVLPEEPNEAVDLREL